MFSLCLSLQCALRRLNSCLVSICDGKQNPRMWMSRLLISLLHQTLLLASHATYPAGIIHTMPPTSLTLSSMVPCHLPCWYYPYHSTLPPTLTALSMPPSTQVLVKPWYPTTYIATSTTHTTTHPSTNYPNHQQCSPPS